MKLHHINTVHFHRFLILKRISDQNVNWGAVKICKQQQIKILMDYSLQVHEAKYVFPVPDGLRELSSDIIREVLRYQPEHINGFIADYLETMLLVRENARDSGVVICDVLRQGFFFDELFATKNITKEQANRYATTIQAGWRGFVVRKKVTIWLQKKKKFAEEKEIRRSLKIQELLSSLGITYDEATRAAGIIQTAYKESKRGRWISNEFGEFWVGESVPFGQRIREGDRVQGRFERWRKEDFEDFFEMDESGAIKHVWPKNGQVRKVLRNNVPKDVPIVEFFASRDQEGHEEYSYLIKSQPNSESRGTPLGFLIPITKSSVTESDYEVEFVNPNQESRMGPYTFIFRDVVEKEDLQKFDELFKTQANITQDLEIVGELEYDPNWVLPRVLIRTRKHLLLDDDDEVKFVALPEKVVCEEEVFAFRAETIQLTAKVIRHILRDKCLTLEEGLAQAANLAPYRIQEAGRIFAVENFTWPEYIQKVDILPETATGEEEALDLLNHEYIYLTPEHLAEKMLPKSDEILIIPMSRFQGSHSDFKGSDGLENKTFILGPKIPVPNGKPLTPETLFWQEYGPKAWYQLLYNIASQQEEHPEEEEEEMDEEDEEEEDFKLDEAGKDDADLDDGMKLSGIDIDFTLPPPSRALVPLSEEEDLEPVQMKAPKLEPKAHEEPETDHEQETKTETEPEIKAESDLEPKGEMESDPKHDTDSDPKTEGEPEIKTEVTEES